MTNNNTFMQAIQDVNWTEYFNRFSFDYLANGSTIIKIDNTPVITIGTSTRGY